MSKYSYYQQVMNAESPAEGLKVAANLLRALDERVQKLEDNQVASTTDTWSTWGEKPESDEWVPDVDVEAELVDLEDKLKGNPDAEESKVLRAKIELTRDRLKPPPEMHDNSQNATEQHVSEDGEVVVEIPPATPEQIDSRAQLVTSLGLRDQYGDELGEKYEAGFIKGGPLLFYYTDRDYINSLPDELKVKLVEDVEISSPREAHDMGRDILKDLDPGTPEQAIERQTTDLESGSIHNAP